MRITRSPPPKKFPLTISERILALRIAANLNQSKLAEILECSQATISKFEQGTSEPNLFQLSKMRQFFGISSDAFIDDQLDFVSIASRFSNYEFSLEKLYIELEKMEKSEATDGAKTDQSDIA